MTKENIFIISHKGDIMFDKFTNIVKFEKYKSFYKTSKNIGDNMEKQPLKLIPPLVKSCICIAPFNDEMLKEHGVIKIDRNYQMTYLKQ